MLKVGVQSAGWYNKNDPLGSFEYIKECGFESIDFNIDHYMSTGKLAKEGIYPTLFDQPIVLNEDAFRKELEESLMDKLERTVTNHRKQPFSPDDLAENLVTGLSSGYYLYFRSVYNDWNLGRVHLSQAQRAANFFFVRENCYGSMFRYNRNGEFNIPYGGMSYNNKDFSYILLCLNRTNQHMFRLHNIYFLFCG